MRHTHRPQIITRTIILLLFAVSVTLLSPHRPSLAADAQVNESAIVLETASGTIDGTLDLPAGAGPFPAVVIVAGSGPTDRDGNQPWMKNDSLKMLGKALAARGIAVLRYDKRAIGQSAAAGPKEIDLRFGMYVADAADWITLLRRDPRFSRIAILGHSEGSLIAMLAAKQAKADAFVSVAGIGRTAADLLREQLAKQLPEPLKNRSNQIIDELIAGRTVAETPQELAALFRPSVQPYLISWFKHDPLREIAALEIPVLIIQGTTDVQVAADDARRLSAAKKDSRLLTIENMNHVMKRATTPAEQRAAYGDVSIPLVPQLVDELAGFLGNSAAKP